MSELFSGLVDYYRKAKGIFSQVRTANYSDTFILLDLYYPTTIQRFTPSNEEIETVYKFNRRTGKITQIVSGQENERFGELTLLYSDYIILKQLKTIPLYAQGLNYKMTLVGQKLLISEKIGDMSESLTRSGLSGQLSKGNYASVCDMDAMNIYNVLITGVGHPVREVDGDRYEITLTFAYQTYPIFIDAALPF